MDIYFLKTAVPDVQFPLHIHKQNQPVGRNERLNQTEGEFVLPYPAVVWGPVCFLGGGGE